MQLERDCPTFARQNQQAVPGAMAQPSRPKNQKDQVESGRRPNPLYVAEIIWKQMDRYCSGARG